MCEAMLRSSEFRNFLFPFEVALEFNEYIVVAVDRGKTIECLECTNRAFATKSRCEWPFFSTSETD